MVKVSEYECFIAEKELVERAPSFIANFRANQQYGTSIASLDSSYSAKLDKTFVGRELEMNKVFDFISENNRNDTHGVSKYSVQPVWYDMVGLRWLCSHRDRC